MASMIRLKQQQENFVAYSEMEVELFNLLRRKADRTASTKWLTEQVYKNLGKEPPPSSRVNVAGAIRSLMKKVKENREPFRIVKTYRTGPHSTEVRIEEI